MKTILLLLMVGSTLDCASCSSTTRPPSAAVQSHSRTVLSEVAVREIALVCAKTDRKNADQYKIERVDVTTVKGRIRWVVMFSMKEHQDVDSDFWVDVDDQTGHTFVRGHFAMNPDDI